MNQLLVCADVTVIMSISQREIEKNRFESTGNGVRGFGAERKQIKQIYVKPRCEKFNRAIISNGWTSSCTGDQK